MSLSLREIEAATLSVLRKWVVMAGKTARWHRWRGSKELKLFLPNAECQPPAGLSVALEVLHRALMLPSRGERFEGAKIAPLARFRIYLPRVQPVFA